MTAETEQVEIINGSSGELLVGVPQAGQTGEEVDITALDHVVLGDPAQHNAVTPAAIITIRMVMHGKEVGSIIGKKGENVKRYREESGAKINITDASCPERIVTVTGYAEQINKAYHLICTKFDELRELHVQTNGSVPLPPQSLKLIMPASQCGSLIGKGGTKIKEIRETTGASVQVASEMLPGSTERTVTVSGSTQAITSCIQEICNIMLESPPKGATIPYRPKPPIQAPLMYAAAAGAAAQAAYTLPSHLQAMAATAAANSTLQSQAASMLQQSMAAATSPVCSSEQSRQPQQSPLVSTASAVNNAAALAAATAAPYTHPQLQAAQLQATQGTPLVLSQPNTAAAAAVTSAAYGGFINPAMLGVGSLGLMGGYLPRNLNNNYVNAQPQTQSTEMVIPNELIGCIIGRGGAKINEIRQLSGAQIKISNCEEGNSDRKVTITGVPETITLAAYLINTSIELHRNQLLSTSDPSALATSQNIHQAASMAAGTLPTAAIGSAAMTAAAYTKPLSVNPFSSATTVGAYGLTANPLASLAVYDPKTILNATKYKMLPSNSVIKQEHRFAPY